MREWNWMKLQPFLASQGEETSFLPEARHDEFIFFSACPKKKNHRGAYGEQLQVIIVKKKSYKVFNCHEKHHPVQNHCSIFTAIKITSVYIWWIWYRRTADALLGNNYLPSQLSENYSTQFYLCRRQISWSALCDVWQDTRPPSRNLEGVTSIVTVFVLVLDFQAKDEGLAQ